MDQRARRSIIGDAEPTVDELVEIERLKACIRECHMDEMRRSGWTKGPTPANPRTIRIDRWRRPGVNPESH